MKKELKLKLETVERLSASSRVARLLNNPIKYVYAIILKNVLYAVFQKEILVETTLFTGKKIKIYLPASTDIYLTGGKTHPSEIRLAKFLINNLVNGDVFWDIGAHYGYFSLLASELVGVDGKVFALEASPVTFNILADNAKRCSNIEVFHNAVSDNNQPISFFELPNLYSEYNTTDLSQFENEVWFSKVKARKVQIDAITMDSLIDKSEITPKIVKIDVEGGEAAVINGGLNLYQRESDKPILVMEYLEPKRNNQPHKQATNVLKKLGFNSYIIRNDGSLSRINEIEAYLEENNLESDNIVFKK